MHSCVSLNAARLPLAASWVGWRQPSSRIACMKSRSVFLLAVLAGVCGWAAPGAWAAEVRPGLTPCRLPGLEHEAWCGKLRRPIDPNQAPASSATTKTAAAAAGAAKDPTDGTIEIHYAVLPALARNRKPDPVFFFAGGPGQSAIDLAGPVSRMLARLGNRRDVVLIDQRGTGRSAPLRCDEDRPTQPLSQSADIEQQTRRLQTCRSQLEKLPQGQAGRLRHYATWVAMQDADAVRQSLGAAQVNLVGGSYGTRAALDYLRQYPQSVRRVVIDGVAPPDMVLPAAFSVDNQAALDAVWAACENQAACRQRYPRLRADWQSLLASLPRTAQVAHPLTGVPEPLTITREMVLSAVRVPLYAPALAAGLPLAVSEAARGRFEPLLGLASALRSGVGKIYEGMHFSVVCAEDAPRLAQSADRPGADYGNTFAEQYKKICADWPRGDVPAAFYSMPQSDAAVLVLSGGADPVTPPRHGDRAVRALGTKARHVVVAQAGHGVMALACMRDVIFKFIDAETDDEANKLEANCAAGVPRPGAFVPLTDGPLAATPAVSAASAAPGGTR
jgi:pimeloyl-ACP methyl ester carboxylesterase